MDLFEVPLCFTGRRRTRYSDAVKTLTQRGVRRSDAYVSMFVKDEKAFPEAKNFDMPDPRPIQPRKFVYNVCVARFLKPMEHLLYRLHRYVPFGVGRIIAKGRNSIQRADDVLLKWRSFANPRVVSLDASRFDMHVNADLLRIEHSVYLAMCDDEEFRELLSWQLSTKGFTREGIRYKVEGGRMSGDMNTALGNCLLMVLMLWDFCNTLEIRFDLYDDGDDILLFIEADDLERVERTVTSHFLGYGMEMKIEGVASEPEEIEFCQSKLVRGERFNRFVRHPWKVVASSTTNAKFFDRPTTARKAMWAVGTCELALGLGLPFHQELAVALRRSGVEGDIGGFTTEALLLRVGRDLKYIGVPLDKIMPQPIDFATRVSYAKAFNMPISEQLVLEEKLRNWVFHPEFSEAGCWFDVDQKMSFCGRVRQRPQWGETESSSTITPRSSNQSIQDPKLMPQRNAKVKGNAFTRTAQTTASSKFKQKQQSLAKSAGKDAGKKLSQAVSRINASKGSVSECVRGYIHCLLAPDEAPPSCAPFNPSIPSEKAKLFVKGQFSTSTTSGFGFITASCNAANDASGIANSEATYTGSTIVASGVGVTQSSFNGAYAAASFGTGATSVQWRPVGFGIYVTYAGTALERGGTYAAVTHPDHATLANQNFSNILSYDGVTAIPVESQRVHCLWFPIDNTEETYSATASCANNNAPVLAVCVRAPEAATSLTFNYEIYLICEFIGKNVRGKTSSGVDPLGAAAVTGYLQDHPMPHIAAEKARGTRKGGGGDWLGKAVGDVLQFGAQAFTTFAPQLLAAL